MDAIEPTLGSCVGQRCSLMAHVVARTASYTVCISNLRRQVFRTMIALNEADVFSLLDVNIQQQEGVFWVVPSIDSHVLPVEPIDLQMPLTAIEVCAGYGIVGQGVLACGIETKCFCDYNEVYCNWLRHKTNVPVVCGDVSSKHTMMAVAQAAPTSQMICSGVACQPFSSLGDRREQLDPRSTSLTGTLEMGYFLSMGVILIECTKEAKESVWVQDVLSKFAAQTGYRIEQVILDLHWLLPASRTRWWALLTHPSLPSCTIPALPSLPFRPMVIHMFPRTLQLTPEEEDQLLLSEHEYVCFNKHPKGIVHHILDTWKTAPTATHSFGNQLQGCACSCRATGFSQRRLDEKGLYGLLVGLDGMVTTEGRSFPRIRHVHAAEIATMNGLDPRYLETDLPTNCRLDLSGVGQMASPFQSGWIMSNLLQTWDSLRIFPNEATTNQVLIKLFGQVFAGRDHVWGFTESTKVMQGYEQALDCLLNTNTFLRSVAMPAAITHDHHEQDEAHFEGFPIHPVAAPSPYTECGGVAMFASTPAPAVVIEPTCAWTQYPTDEVADQPEPKRLRTDSPEPVSPHESPVSPESILEGDCEETPRAQLQQNVCVYVAYPGEDPGVIMVTEGTTVGQLLMAEEKVTNQPFICAVDPVGQIVNITQQLSHGQRIMLYPTNWDVTQYVSQLPEESRVGDRLCQLWHQQGYVGFDEMDFYLRVMQQATECQTTPPIFAANKCDLGLHVDEWVMSFVEKGEPCTCYTAVLYQQHWMPLAVRITQQTAELRTSPDGVTQLSDVLDVMHHEGFSIHMRPFGHRFAHDCGFQSIAWIDGQQRNLDEVHTVSDSQMVNMRSAFELHLRSSQQDMQVFMAFGGTTDASLTAKLVALLEEHAVSPDRSHACAQNLLGTLGTTSIQQTMKSPKPWKDLKAKASQCRPAIQLVLASELEAAVKARVDSGQTFGRKSNSQKQPVKPPVTITPDQINIPVGIFQQDDGVMVSQIGLHQVGANAKGIAVVTPDQACPFLKLTDPLSQEGLSLLVLGEPDARLPANQEVISFPANFCATDEPVILRGSLLHLGKIKIKRALPSNITAIDEVSTCAYRILVYRDQLDCPWETFLQKPVKTILQADELQVVGPDLLLDLWDRQWLDQGFRRSSPKDAFLFAVTVRIKAEHMTVLESVNATRGMFIEPRSDNGRSPSDPFRVVWLPKKQFGDTQMAKHVTTHPCSVVRSGNRFGLRVKTEDAKAVHAQHRPEVDWMDGTKVTYRIGPLPYGTTKKALGKALQQLGWLANPGQPLGQSSEGCFWSVTATSPPSHWLFTMKHGDVLISVRDDKEPTQTPVRQQVIASTKTMNFLQKGPKPAASTNDPWLDADPWAKYQGVNGPPKHVSSQIAALENTITQKVMAQVKQAEADAPMSEADPRVDRLEAQVQSLSENLQQLSTSVTAQQQSQGAHNNHVQNQIGGLKHQLDAHAAAFQSAIETKFEDQMSRIEILLNKRAKLHE
eukprot:Skav206840  [mRNA]  locus=scaffold637:191806:196263:- [translate_table: standard]